MKKSIMRKWVAALRSGEYVQGRGRLVSDKDEFCCLGVLCNLAVDAGIGEWEKRGNTWGFVTPDDPDAIILPHEVRAWAGMKHCNGEFPGIYVDRRVALSRLNDEGKSFSEIADIIEANWEVL